MRPLDLAARKRLITAASVVFRDDKREEYVRVLEFLAENPGRDKREWRTKGVLEYVPEKREISTYLTRLQHLLDKFFHGPGGTLREHRIRIVIGQPGEHHPDAYELLFPLNSHSLMRRFWKLDAKVETAIVYGLPLFIRTENPVSYRREAAINLPAQVAPGSDVRFPFVAHGDLLAAVALTETFASQNVPVRFRAFTANDDLEQLRRITDDTSNAVILGSVRVSGLLADYQSSALLDGRHLRYRLDVHDVIRVNDEGVEMGDRYREEPDDCETVVPVVITRRRGKLAASDITLIAANHGMAVYGATQILTEAMWMERLFTDPRLEPWRDALPETFQILLMVTVMNSEKKWTEFRVAEVWTPGDRSSSRPSTS